jgi:hypothetical protein
MNENTLFKLNLAEADYIREKAKERRVVINICTININNINIIEDIINDLHYIKNVGLYTIEILLDESAGSSSHV